jgi:hypothetical protein
MSELAVTALLNSKKHYYSNLSELVKELLGFDTVAVLIESTCLETLSLSNIFEKQLRKLLRKVNKLIKRLNICNCTTILPISHPEMEHRGLTSQLYLTDFSKSSPVISAVYLQPEL